ncbi:MAG TPA: hypothetical protein VK814_12180 [Acidobacteriaceae bacterium]|jgi:hypothetical protein|nr:hypothetical protein [Acidobacteriaceae bacterium]
MTSKWLRNGPLTDFHERNSSRSPGAESAFMPLELLGTLDSSLASLRVSMAFAELCGSILIKGDPSFGFVKSGRQASEERTAVSSAYIGG